MLQSVPVTSVLFLVRFNNFALTTGFYWSYMLLLKSPVLMHSWVSAYALNCSDSSNNFTSKMYMYDLCISTHQATRWYSDFWSIEITFGRRVDLGTNI